MKTKQHSTSSFVRFIEPKSNQPFSFSGFTLVELLVVISIIGIIMGLMIPAVNAARERARETACVNNVKQSAYAVLLYVTQNERFPGWRNEFKSNTSASTSAGIYGSWVAAILPNLNEGALQKNWSEGKADVTFLPYMICPSDAKPNKSEPFLSYVANCGYNSVKKNPRNYSVFIDRKAFPKPIDAQTLDYITANDGTATTIMLSENNQAYVWGVQNNSDSANINWQGFVYFESNPNDVGTKIQAINWDNRGVLAPTDLSSLSSDSAQKYARPSSYHPGRCMSAFCDSRVISLRDDIDYSIYKMIMTPNDSDALGSDATASTAVLMEMIQ